MCSKSYLNNKTISEKLTKGYQDLLLQSDIKNSLIFRIRDDFTKKYNLHFTKCVLHHIMHKFMHHIMQNHMLIDYAPHYLTNYAQHYAPYHAPNLSHQDNLLGQKFDLDPVPRLESFKALKC